jgi:hypothetical protein
LEAQVTHESSVDRFEQRGDRVLTDDVYVDFWSSTGSQDNSGYEELVFSLEHPAIIGRVEFQPYKAGFQRNCPIYAPRFVQILVYESDVNSREVYVSDRLPVENTNALYSVHFAPVLVIGKCIQLKMFGKWQVQEEFDNLYYTCLSKVRFFGIYAKHLLDSYDLFMIIKNQSSCVEQAEESNGVLFDHLRSGVLSDELASNVIERNQDDVNENSFDEMKSDLTGWRRDSKFRDAFLHALLNYNDQQIVAKYLKFLTRKRFSFQGFPIRLTELEVYVICKFFNSKKVFNVFNQVQTQSDISEHYKNIICAESSSEIIGDWLFMNKKYDMASTVFQNCKFFEKQLRCLVKIAHIPIQFGKFINLLSALEGVIDLNSVFEELLASHHPYVAAKTAILLVNQGVVNVSQALEFLRLPNVGQNLAATLNSYYQSNLAEYQRIDEQ